MTSPIPSASRAAADTATPLSPVDRELQRFLQLVHAAAAELREGMSSAPTLPATDLPVEPPARTALWFWAEALVPHRADEPTPSTTFATRGKADDRGP